MAALRRRIPLPLVLVLGFLVLQALAAPAALMTNDSYRYGRSALQILGHTREEATDRAVRAWCVDQSAEKQRERERSAMRFRHNAPPGELATCLHTWRNGLGPVGPRYEAIFDARPGYPLLAAPFVAAFGVSSGLWIASLLCTAIGGWLAYVLLRAVGLAPRFAALGQILYYVTPLGLWGSYPLGEGPAFALTMASLLGAVWLIQRRVAAGAALVAGSLVAGFLVKSSSALLGAAALAAAAVVLLWRHRAARHRGVRVLLGVSAGTLAALVAVNQVLGWPGAAESLQDTFTRHFYRPDVDDPWRRLAKLNLNYWTQWLQTQARAPWLLAIMAAAAFGLFRRRPLIAWPVTFVALTGVATIAAHPFLNQEQRLMAPLWILPVIGVPLLLGRLLPGPAPHPRPASGDGPTVVSDSREPTDPRTGQDRGHGAGVRAVLPGGRQP